MLQQSRMLVDQNKRLPDIVNALVQVIKKQKCCSCGKSKHSNMDALIAMNTTPTGFLQDVVYHSSRVEKSSSASGS
eukprot:8899661-Ditylum_brightwellii.AAC.1